MGALEPGDVVVPGLAGPLNGWIGASGSMKLPSAFGLFLKSSLLLFVASDVSSFSFPLEEVGSDDGDRLSGASARWRSSGWGVTPDSPTVVSIMCCLDWTMVSFQAPRYSPFFT